MRVPRNSDDYLQKAPIKLGGVGVEMVRAVRQTVSQRMQPGIRRTGASNGDAGREERDQMVRFRMIKISYRGILT